VSTVRIDDVLYNVYDEHQRIFLPGQECYRCVQRQRDTLSILEARIADQDAEISGLRRQINALEHRVNDLQRAHNAIAPHVRPNVPAPDGGPGDLLP
jgi:uncharacterized coiled-coil protein SlyX